VESLIERRELRSSRISMSVLSRRWCLVVKPGGRVKRESEKCFLDQASSGNVMWLKSLFEPVMTDEFRSCLRRT